MASAFEADSQTIIGEGYKLTIEISQPGFIRAKVDDNTNDSTIIEWSHDTAWRFFPTVTDPTVGYRLHSVDLAVNKVLALVGRDEPRDIIDTLAGHSDTRSLGALLWAAAGKDPGYTPLGLLDRLRRKRTPRSEELDRLNLTQAVDPVALKEQWLLALDDAQQFIESRPASETGCLYWDTSRNAPTSEMLDQPGVVAHYGQLYGVLPTIR